MKRMISLVLFVLVMAGGVARAEEFLGAPIMPDGKLVSESDHQRVMTYALPVADVVAFYQESFKDAGDSLRIREIKPGEFWIEDFDVRKWHKITLLAQGDETSVTITQDSWLWIITMLAFRFLGVFVVLLALFVALSVSTKVLAHFTTPEKAKAA